MTRAKRALSRMLAAETLRVPDYIPRRGSEGKQQRGCCSRRCRRERWVHHVRGGLRIFGDKHEHAGCFFEHGDRLSVGVNSGACGWMHDRGVKLKSMLAERTSVSVNSNDTTSVPADRAVESGSTHLKVAFQPFFTTYADPNTLRIGARRLEPMNLRTLLS
eukprot:4699059-Pyramimonas_sp.AAC.2